jgi:hypothetical protein
MQGIPNDEIAKLLGVATPQQKADVDANNSGGIDQTTSPGSRADIVQGLLGH